MKRINAFYNRIAFVYPLVGFFLKPYRNILIREINSAVPGRLLEVGVGSGEHLQFYQKHEITGIDISEAMLSKAMRYQGQSISLALMDGEDMKFPDASFDHVVLSHVISVANNPDRLLSEIYRVLKPGGTLYVLNHFTPGNALKYVDKAFDPLSRALYFRSLFRLEDVKGFDRFVLKNSKSLGMLSYFKLLILTRP